MPNVKRIYRIRNRKETIQVASEAMPTLAPCPFGSAPPQGSQNPPQEGFGAKEIGVLAPMSCVKLPIPVFS